MPTLPKPIPELTEKDKQRFWSNVAMAGPSECWCWTARKHKRGYGVFSLSGEDFRAHRISFALSGRVIPEGLHVLHNCPGGDNPSCVNPIHLWAGTHAQNMIDREAKGRGVRRSGDQHGLRLHPERIARGLRNGKYTKPECTPRGERVHTSKLTADKVREMRIRCANGETYSELGRVFGVAKNNARKAILGVSWTHIT